MPSATTVIDAPHLAQVEEMRRSFVINGLGEAQMWARMGVIPMARRMMTDVLKEEFDSSTDDERSWLTYRNGAGDAARLFSPDADGARLLLCFNHENGERTAWARDDERVPSYVLGWLGFPDVHLAHASDDRAFGMVQSNSPLSVTSAFRIEADGTVVTGSASADVDEEGRHPEPLPFYDDEWQVWDGYEPLLEALAAGRRGEPILELLAASVTDIPDTRLREVFVHEAYALLLRAEVLAPSH